MNSGEWRLGRRPGLDGLRAVAALLVVATHVEAFFFPGSTLLAGGALGITLFFVLSGFLITSLLLEEHRARGRIGVGGFYLRRARRLFPAAGTVLIVWSVASLAQGTSLRRVGQSALVIATYTTDYFKNSHRDVILGLGHFWTLAVEEQFYLVWPLMLVGLLAAKASPRLIVGAALVGAAVVTAHRALMLHDLPAESVVYRADAICDGLLIGVALAVAFHAGLVHAGRWSRWGFPALAGFLAVVLVSPLGALSGPWPSSLTATAGAVLTALMIAAAMNPAAYFTRALSSPVPRYLGKISYSIYLWHVPIIVSVTHLGLSPVESVIVVLPLTLLVAAVSRKYIEEPFLHRRARMTLDAADHGSAVGDRVGTADDPVAS